MCSGQMLEFEFVEETLKCDESFEYCILSVMDLEGVRIRAFVVLRNKGTFVYLISYISSVDPFNVSRWFVWVLEM